MTFVAQYAPAVVGGPAPPLAWPRWPKAHKDRYESERLVPVFQSLGLAGEVTATTEFATREAASLYVR